MKAAVKISVLIMSFTLLACGAQKTGNGSNSLNSTGTLPGQPPIGPGTTSNVAECNGVTANAAGITGAVSSYFDPSTQSYRDDLGRIYLTQVPADLATNESKYLQITRWQINTATGNPVYQTTPLNLWLLLRSTGRVLNVSAPISILRKSTIEGAISTYGLGALGITAANFFRFVILIPTGIAAADNAYRISIYDASSGTASESVGVDVLMPPFYANPYVYKQARPYTALYNLHPNINMASGLSDATYMNATLPFCQTFFN